MSYTLWLPFQSYAIVKECVSMRTTIIHRFQWKLCEHRYQTDFNIHKRLLMILGNCLWKCKCWISMSSRLNTDFRYIYVSSTSLCFILLNHQCSHQKLIRCLLQMSVGHILTQTKTCANTNIYSKSRNSSIDDCNISKSITNSKRVPGFRYCKAYYKIYTQR